MTVAVVGRVRSTGCRDEKHSCATRAALSQFFSRDDGMASTAARMAWSPVAHGMHGGRAGSSIRTGTADVRRLATSRCGGMRSVTCSSPSGVKRREGRSFANGEATVSLDSLCDLSSSAAQPSAHGTDGSARVWSRHRLIRDAHASVWSYMCSRSR